MELGDEEEEERVIWSWMNLERMDDSTHTFKEE